MSWAEEDWTVGLSGQVLHKVKELQVHKERLSRENKQRQIQLDNSQDALNKQKIKHDEVRRELQILQRELKMVQDQAQTQTNSAERLSLDLQTKQTLVCSLEGQLDAARTLTQNLTQEVKRLEAELEKLQTSQEASLFSTPCWNTASPWEPNAGKPEERTGRRGDGDGRAVHVRQQLQFSGTPAASSSPRQGRRGCPPPHQSETFSTPSAAFPWERDDSRSPGQGHYRAAAPQTPPPPSVPPGASQPQQREHLGKEADARVSELRGRVGALEEELRAEKERLRAGQEQLGRSREELAAAETRLQKSRDQISLAQGRTLQESDRASVAEQKAKKLQEELRCERQNADSCRLQHQQRTKELEKRHQMDLSELQKERQRLERQHQEEVTKLSQELLQARVQHNTLQAQAEKVHTQCHGTLELSQQKQALEREVDSLKAKLKWTEGQLQESQKKAAQTQAKLTESLHEAQGVAASLEQSTRRAKSLEEEGRRVAQERDDARRLLKELREHQALAQPAAPQPRCSLGQSFSPAEPRPAGSSRNPPGEPQPRPPARVRPSASGHPPDREPGEGLDAEHMTAAAPAESERPPRGVKPGDEEGEEEVVVVAPASDSRTRAPAPAPAEQRPSQGQGGDAAALRKENQALSSDLRDAREELQRRLEDLEAQRRAEQEARSRLKQLSKKRAGREAELEEQERGRKAELERERAETERLRRAVVSLQAQLGAGEKRAEEEGLQGEQEREDREQELTELNVQMKAQLSEARAQLALEREERQRGEEERQREEEERQRGEEERQRGEEERREREGTGVDLEEVKQEVSMSLRLAELEAELEKLRRRDGEEDDGPLTDPALGYELDDLNANVAALLPGLRDNRRLLPATEESRRLLLCHVANQLNATQQILTEDQRAELFRLPLLVGDSASPMEESSPELEDATVGEPGGAPCRPGTPDPGREVERLREEKRRMARRAEQCQAKLEALQSQVTVQTQQLTTAFDLQSSHIRGLLAELQQKGSDLLIQGRELQHCRGELALLQARAAEGNPVTDPDLGAGEGSELRPAGPPSEWPSREAVAPGEPDQTCRQRQGCKAEAPPSRVLPGAQACTPDTLHPADPPGAPTPGRQGGAGTETQGHHSSSSSSSSEVLPTSGGSDPGAKTEPCAVVPPPQAAKEERERPGAGPAGARSEGPQEEVSGDGMNGDVGADQEDQVPLDRVSHLEQQLVALQAQLRVVSEDKKKQAEELVLWRLSSLSTPASRLREQSNGVDDPTVNGVELGRLDPSPGPAGPEERPDVLQGRGPLTVIREDRLILSCSSGKLQGTLLTSRLQHSGLTEPKSLLDVGKTDVPRNADDLIDDEGSDKENTDTNHAPAAATRPPAPLALSQRASGDQRRGPRDASRGPPQTRGPQRSEDPTAPATTQREAGGWPSCRSAGTQTHAPGPSPTPAPAPLHHAATQTQEEALVEGMAAAAADAGAEARRGSALLFASSFPLPADPARLAERIRRHRGQLSAAFDDTEYEPYGLPEVVMKGFADIPSGPSCPYIVRRGLLGTPAVPVPQADTPPAEETD